MSLNFNSIPTKTLSESITSAATSFKLNNITGWDGVDLASGDFGTVGYGIFVNANKTQIELFEFDPSTIASASITINKRGLKFTGDLTTQVSGNKFSWTKGDTYVNLGTDTPQIFQWLKEYIDGVAIAGAPDASASTKGIVKMSTAPASPTSPIAVGDNDPRVPTQDEKDAMAGDLGTPSPSVKYLTSANKTQQVTFTSSGTWTKDSGLVRIKVEAWGGGGSGGWQTGGAAVGGGGGGAYSEKWFEASELSATETVTIGAGGTAVSTGSGNNGGNTTFGSLLTAYGGKGGSNSTTGGNGGEVQTGETILRGAGGSSSVGGVGILYGGGGGGGGVGMAGGAALYGGGGGGARGSGVGGNSIYGGDGAAGADIGTGASGSVPGGGGGGVAGTATLSGAGGSGKVIVTEYYI